VTLPAKIFFELRGVLIDPDRERQVAPLAQARYLAAHFGGSVEAWQAAGYAIAADWDSYYADLDLGGDEGYADFLEGEFRTVRARFHLTNTPEPSARVIREMAAELAYVGAAACNALYPAALEVITHLTAAGHILGIVSNQRTTAIQGALMGSGITHHFTGPLIGVETVEQFVKDANFYRQLNLSPAQSLIVDCDTRALDAAQATGFQTALFRQVEPHPADSTHPMLLTWQL
jgi:FMN phosphatase YigB (HAD superfamily)